jgi:hypothetical protein
MRPVTQTAEVEVNNASMKEHPFVFETGSIRSSAPVRITEKNPSARICGGESLSFIRMLWQDEWFLDL